jgi:acyl-CoA synthetase (AMP-forming)/AMP-acid ligase II
VSHETNIAGALFRMAAQQPDATAIHYPRGPRSKGRARYQALSYRALSEDAARIAAGLSSIGIVRGTRCALMVRPSPEFFALAFGLFHAGVVPIIVDPGIGLRNLRTCLGEARPEAFIGIPEAHLARLALGWARDTIRTTVTVGPRLGWGGSSLDEVRRAGEAAVGWQAPAVEEDDVAAVVFTSGSTGVAKGVVYTHGNFAAQVRMLREALRIEPGEIDLPTFPLFALFDPALGMTTVLPKMDFTRPAKVDPREILEPVRLFGVRTMFGSPALLDRVGRYAEPRGEAMPSLRRVISAGAPVPTSVIERFLKLLAPEARILTPYGATESLPVALIAHDEILRDTAARTKAGAGVCVGRPVEGVRVEIIGISDEPIESWSDALRVPGETVGELVVAGPNVTRSYFGRDEATRLAKIRGPNGETMHRMGDLGSRDAEGRLWFCGRKSHRVVTRAGTLFTDPCEAPFCAHPDVRRAALVGVPRGGDVAPVMCVELEAGARARPALFAELAAIAKQHAHTRAIDTFLVHPSFPVDIRHNSKIFREKLAVWARERAASS